jgi:hypothetical protein
MLVTSELQLKENLSVAIDHKVNFWVWALGLTGLGSARKSQ